MLFVERCPASLTGTNIDAWEVAISVVEATLKAWVAEPLVVQIIEQLKQAHAKLGQGGSAHHTVE